jgi:hypothetical protein
MLTQARLKAVFFYAPVVGVFIRKTGVTRWLYDLTGINYSKRRMLSGACCMMTQLVPSDTIVAQFPV